MKGRRGDFLEITESSGNVFRELELPYADRLLAKADLSRQLGFAIR